MKKILLILLFILFTISVQAYEINPTLIFLGNVNTSSLSTSFVINNTELINLSLEIQEEINFTVNGEIVIVQATFNPSSLFLSPNSTQNIRLDFKLPENSPAGNYVGYILIINSETNETEYLPIGFKFVDINRVTISRTKMDFGTVYYNQTSTQNFLIKNEGNLDISNIEFISNADSKYELNFEPSTINTLTPGEAKQVDVNIFLPYGDEPINAKVLGNLIVNGADITINDFFAIDIRSYLSIENIKFTVEGDSDNVEKGDKVDDKAKPLDLVEIEVKIENLYESIGNKEIKIQDVELEVIVEAIDADGDDIKLKSDDVSLNYEGNNKDHTFELNFNIPPETQSDTYQVQFNIVGEDKEGNEFDETWYNEFEVERDDHDLVIDRLELNTNTIKCKNNVVVDFEIWNVGDNDEDYVRYILSNDELGINEEKSRFEIESEEDDFEYSESVLVDIENPVVGEHEIRLIVYRDFDKYMDDEKVTLTIEQCGSTPPPEQPQDDVNDDQTEKDTDDEDETSTTDTNQPVSQIPEDNDNKIEETEKEQSNDIYLLGNTYLRKNNSELGYILILVLMSVIVLLGIIVVLIYRKE